MTRVAVFALVAVLAACSPEPGPEAGGQTNWLLACDSSDECGGFECVCGACLASCDADTDCAGLPDASCVPASDRGAIALCGGQLPPSGLCLPLCAESCAEGTSCVAGVCVATGTPSVQVTIDPAARHQTLVGFGASLAYADDVIVARSDKDALYDLLFADSGLDALRLRNRYDDGTGARSLQPSREIVAAAAERFGRTPFLFLTSSTPPAALKANGSRSCNGDVEACTLVKVAGGAFDYAGFAEYWRASLEAYAAAGIFPDYVGIQNHPNLVPSGPGDACRFLPEEGTTTVMADGSPVEVTYPGYREALAAVRAALADLPMSPRLGAPEATGPRSVVEYVPQLDAAGFDAVALHLYGQDATSIDMSALEAVRALAEQSAHPVFQTEMQAEGLDTAIFVHYALTVGGASAYLQNDLVSWTAEMAPVSLVFLEPGGLEAQGPYYALSHYAKSTDPGWVRVDARSDSNDLLGSAWLAPDENTLSVVLVNPGSQELDAQLVVGPDLRTRLARTKVARTVFEGIERAAVLGALPASGVVRLPGKSILTVELATE
jgi:glucuronoarabinoxylan endo-1,4-beta-xylanase